MLSFAWFTCVPFVFARKHIGYVLGLLAYLMLFAVFVLRSNAVCGLFFVCLIVTLIDCLIDCGID